MTIEKGPVLAHPVSAACKSCYLSFICKLSFSLEEAAEPLHPLLTLHHADKAPGFNGTMKIRIFIYFNTYKIVTSCINEFSIRLWILFTHL